MRAGKTTTEGERNMKTILDNPALIDYSLSNMTEKPQQETETMDKTFANNEAAEIIAAVAAAPTSIIFIKGYVAKSTGEVSNVFAIKGASYANTVAKSLKELATMEADENLSLTVKWKEWINTVTGKKTTAACKTKQLIDKSMTLSADSDILKGAFAKVRKSLEDPKDPTVSYSKEGHGVYSHNEELFLRDCRVLHKQVIEPSEKIRTSSLEVAAADKIRYKLAIGKYRAYKLDGRYEYISIGGGTIVPADCKEEVEAEQSKAKAEVEA